MKLLVYIVFICFVFLTACKDSPIEANQGNRDNIIQEVIDQTNLDTLSYFVRLLSGEIPVNINGTTHLIYSRHKNHIGNNLSGELLFQILNNYGHDVRDQWFSKTGRNIYATQRGLEFPDQYYILCAHYDSMPDSSVSPGADDNASGTAAVLEAARILKSYQIKYSLIYALWDEEEQGLVGAFNYAYQARSNGDDILGVINLDMIGWDSNNDGRFWINVRDTANSTHLSERMVQIHDDYEIGLSPQVLNPGSGSDNVAFWYYGFSAIGVEEMYGEDWNTNYHKSSDQIIYFNLSYFESLTQLLIGTAASLAEVQEQN
jgi:hypothetical protein